MSQQYYNLNVSDAYSAYHWTNGTQVPNGPTFSRSAAMHATNYHPIANLPPNFTQTFPAGGAPPHAAYLPTQNTTSPSRKAVASAQPSADETDSPYIRNKRQDPEVVAANAGTDFLGYHTYARDRTVEAVFFPPPQPGQAVPQYSPMPQAVPRTSSTGGLVRRVSKVIEPGQMLVMLFDDGPRVVQAIEAVQFLVYSVRAHWTIIGSWNERKYAIVDPSSEVALRGRMWYRFIQPIEMMPSEVRPLMQSCLERKGWEFVDARPAGWHLKRRQNEVPFLEMLMRTEIDWQITEWMVGDAKYSE